MNRKTVMPVVTLFILCLCVTALVACANFVTKDVIESNLDEAQKAAMAVLIPDADFEKADAVFSDSNIVEAYVAKKDGKTVGYIVKTLGEGGYGGAVPVTTALDENGVVTGLNIDAGEETPGLGQNVMKQEYIDRYIGKETNEYQTVKGSPAKDGEVQAVTGATKSSKAVTKAVNLAKAAYAQMTGGGTQ